MKIIRYILGTVLLGIGCATILLEEPLFGMGQ